ncbi:MAG TPA: NAD-dependent epimerase/dehydratase family protein [Acidimicrobiales bacterium]|nr:NAD-dependent epimerase/dehydratase family protein [Acidimicrobiales bacterium]
MSRLLVTGGSGYFGTILVDRALERGHAVRILDVNPPDEHRAGLVDVVVADVRDRDAVRAACDGIDVVLHNVAQVPLARDRDLFESVNVTGTANVLVAARDAGVAKVVSTSSSAIFGIPDHNPVTEVTPPRPLEAYGRAKAEAEALCREAVAGGLDVTIIRPRTILGHGRLGIMAILFEFVAEGAPVYVLGSGENRYQFVHADDLAAACLLAAERPGSATYNIGSTEFGTMRGLLEALVDHAGTGSKVRSLPVAPARLAMRGLSVTGQAPFAPYHWLLYSESLWFDTTKAQAELGWSSTRSSEAALIESYEWFLANRGSMAAHGDGGSHHQSPVKLGVLRLLKRLA